MKRIQLLLLALLACGLVAVGCGDDDDDTADTTDEPAVTETAPVDTTAEGTEGEESDGDFQTEGEDGEALDRDDPNVQRAIESCKQSVQGAAQLSDDVKSDLEDICEQAAEGDEEAVRDASIAVCKKIVEDSVPAGSARDQALSSCEQAG